MTSAAEYPAMVPASVPQLRAALLEHRRTRCDGLLEQLLGERVRIGQLVMVSGEAYRVGGIEGTGIRWLDPRPYSPVLGEVFPYREPDREPGP